LLILYCFGFSYVQEIVDRRFCSSNEEWDPTSSKKEKAITPIVPSDDEWNVLNDLDHEVNEEQILLKQIFRRISKDLQLLKIYKMAKTKLKRHLCPKT